MDPEKKVVRRRDFIRTSAKTALAGSLLASGFPTIVPASVFGKNAPSNRINVAAGERFSGIPAEEDAG